MPDNRLTIDVTQRIQQISAHYDEGGKFGEIGGTQAIIGELLVYLNAAMQRAAKLRETLTECKEEFLYQLEECSDDHFSRLVDKITEVLASEYSVDKEK